MRLRLSTLVLLFGAALAVPAAAQAPLRLATWNMEWLTDRASPGGDPRSAEDYARFAHYADAVRADVIALQEVDGPEAAARVFSPDDYAFYFEPGDNIQRTGFAVRRGIEVVDDPDYVELRTGNARLRAGTVITVSVAGRPLRLMSVHMKSGCFDVPLATESDACNGLRPQIPVLEAWIDEQAAGDVPFAILGDFNRRLNTPGDEVWAQWDDGEPADADLMKVTEGRTSSCENGRYPDFIDHIVLDRRAAAWLLPHSFQQTLYAEGETARLSDHCPISVRLQPGAALPNEIRWFRNSSERIALSFQTYLAAGVRLRDLARQSRSPVGTWAVILDADETILDNSVYQRRRAEVDSAFTSASWAAWVREEAAPAIPGAVEFTHIVRELGGRVVVVTNRDESQCDATRANLAAVGVNAAAVLCLQGGVSNKNPRFEAVQNGSVPGLPALRVLMWVGDNINDFPGLSQELRLGGGAGFARFGNDFWMLPNPMYGSWEGLPDAPPGN